MRPTAHTAPGRRSIQSTTCSGRPASSRPVTIRSAKRPSFARAFTEPTIQSLAVGWLDSLRSAFSFLGTRSRGEDAVAQYIIREHHRDRSLAEILDDPYVVNRCTRE